jgi:hypothetical protein
MKYKINCMGCEKELERITTIVEMPIVPYSWYLMNEVELMNYRIIFYCDECNIIELFTLFKYVMKKITVLIVGMKKRKHNSKNLLNALKVSMW